MWSVVKWPMRMMTLFEDSARSLSKVECFQWVTVNSKWNGGVNCQLINMTTERFFVATWQWESCSGCPVTFTHNNNYLLHPNDTDISKVNRLLMELHRDTATHKTGFLSCWIRRFRSRQMGISHCRTSCTNLTADIVTTLIHTGAADTTNELSAQ